LPYSFMGMNGRRQQCASEFSDYGHLRQSHTTNPGAGGSTAGND
jgi:hypothetical protein